MATGEHNPHNLLFCCMRCQFYSSCITKWLRGEKGEPDYCCDHCQYFYECHPHLVKKQNPENKDK
ncbi:MAG: hypothetical protein N3A72_02750 [bacterium]|nr:hypothetical protein [bacterium]